MSETWSVEKLFEDERGRNPFSRDPEEMLLWECNGDEAVCVYRGYEPERLQFTMLQLQKSADPGTTFCVEFPGRKGEAGSRFVAKRAPVTGAKCLPNPEQKMLVSMIERRWGATLNERDYMASRGKTMNFYMRSDAKRETVFSFNSWDEVRTMAYTRRP